MREQLADRYGALALLREFGPVRGHRGVQVNQPVLHQQAECERGHTLGAGEHTRHRIGRGIGSAHQVNHFCSLVVDGELGTVAGLGVEHGIKKIPDGCEQGCTKAGCK